MDWLDEVRERDKRKNQMLFQHNSLLLLPLGRLLEDADRRAVVLWALELAEETAGLLSERYPEDGRPMEVVAECRRWAAGEIAMPQAKRAILKCHAMAKELSSPEDRALCHAVGQGGSTVHTPGHALGYPIYELTALARRHGLDACRESLEARAERYAQRLIYWRAHWQDQPRTWAKFLEK